MTIRYTCGCVDPPEAYLVEYECSDHVNAEGWGMCVVTSSMCALHTIRQLACGEVRAIHRIEPPVTA